MSDELYRTAMALLDHAEGMTVKRAFEPIPAGQPMQDPNAAGGQPVDPNAAAQMAPAGGQMDPMAAAQPPADPNAGQPAPAGADIDTIVAAVRQVMQEMGAGGQAQGQAQGEPKKKGKGGEVEERLAALEAAVSGLGQYLQILSGQGGMPGAGAAQGFGPEGSGAPASPAEDAAAVSGGQGMAPLDMTGGAGMQVSASLQAKKIGRLVSKLRN